MATSTLTRKGQTTVPRDIREHLGLRPGDTLEFVIEADGGVRLRPRRLRLADLAGMLKRPGQRALTQDEIDDAIAEAASERALGQ